MNFDLPPVLAMVRETAAAVARRVVAPRAASIDEEGVYPEDVFQAFREHGLLGLAWPEECGGAGVSHPDGSPAGTLALCLAVEEVAKYCSSSGLILLLTKLPLMPIWLGGNEEQKQRYIGGVCEGRLKGAFCLTEPEAGSDAAAIRTTAVLAGDSYVLNGVKCFISGATVADFFTVAARMGIEPGHKGIGVFVVDRDAPGLKIGKVERKMGVKGVPVAEVVFQDCFVPRENLVGPPGVGFRILMQTLNAVRPVVAARGLGLAEGALEYGVAYARERRAFGCPIIDFQGLRWMVAEMAMRIEAARWLTYRAAALVDQGRVSREDAPYLSMAKAFATETAVFVADGALQLLGGHGYMKDHPTERYYRDARQLTIVEGTSQIQREIIGRSVAEGLLHWA